MSRRLLSRPGTAAGVFTLVGIAAAALLLALLFRLHRRRKRRNDPFAFEKKGGGGSASLRTDPEVYDNFDPAYGGGSGQTAAWRDGAALYGSMGRRTQLSRGQTSGARWSLGDFDDYYDHGYGPKNQVLANATGQPQLGYSNGLEGAPEAAMYTDVPTAGGAVPVIRPYGVNASSEFKEGSEAEHVQHSAFLPRPPSRTRTLPQHPYTHQPSVMTYPPPQHSNGGPITIPLPASRSSSGHSHSGDHTRVNSTETPGERHPLPPRRSVSTTSHSYMSSSSGHSPLSATMSLSSHSHTYSGSSSSRRPSGRSARSQAESDFSGSSHSQHPTSPNANAIYSPSVYSTFSSQNQNAYSYGMVGNGSGQRVFERPGAAMTPSTSNAERSSSPPRPPRRRGRSGSLEIYQPYDDTFVQVPMRSLSSNGHVAPPLEEEEGDDGLPSHQLNPMMVYGARSEEHGGGGDAHSILSLSDAVDYSRKIV